MSFDSIRRLFGQKRHTQRGGRKHRRNDNRLLKKNAARLAVEALEERTLLSTMPAPIVNGQIPVFSGNRSAAPSVVVDPVNPQKMVAVFQELRLTGSAQFEYIVGAYTLNGGQTWLSFDMPTNDFDPTTSNPIVQYTQASDPTVAIDRNEAVYVVYTEHNNDLLGANTSGELVLQKFDFSGGAPVALTNTTPSAAPGSEYNLLYAWFKQDPALNPRIVLDTNLPATQTNPANPGGAKVSFVDPATGATMTDPNVDPRPTDPNTHNTQGQGLLYVLWNTNNKPFFSNPTPPPNFNPDVIKAVASSDGGNSFTGAMTLNAVTSDQDLFSRNFGNQRLAFPTAVFSSGTTSDRPQGSGGTPGGQLTAVWNDFAVTDKGGNRIVTTRVATSGSAEYYFTPGPILDAIQVNGNNIPQETDFPIVISPTDPQFQNWEFANNAPLSHLSVTIAAQIPHLNDTLIQLVSPSINGQQHVVTLLANQVNAAGQAIQPAQGVNDSQNLGIVAGIDLGTNFDDGAVMKLRDQNATAPYVATFLPEFGSLDFIKGLTPAQIAGTWTLRITDFNHDGDNPPRPSHLDKAVLHFATGLLPAGDIPAVRTPGGVGPIPGAVAAESGVTFPTLIPAAPDLGVGAVPSIASDNTLGSFSPYQGRLYLTYVAGAYDRGNNDPTGQHYIGGANTNVYLVTSDDGGISWSSPVQVNDDNPGDGFSEGSRSQFQPQVAVDPLTGTVALSWYDARYDAANARPATFVTYSLDGGASFSPQVYGNASSTATDAITGQNVVLEPIGANESAGNGARDPFYAFGNRQGLVVYGGHVLPVWTDNYNGMRAAGIYTANITIPAGPRVVATPDQGPVLQALTVSDSGGNSITYDNTLLPDGTRLPDGFVVSFDRPVDPASFTKAQAQVVFRNTTTPANQPGVSLLITAVTPLDQGLFGAAQIKGATRFLVRFDPTRRSDGTAYTGSHVGTYSYAVGPAVSDRIRQPAINVIVGGPAVNYPSAPGQNNIPIPPDAASGDTGGPNSPHTLSVITVSGVPANQVITHIDVNVFINHTFDSDLVITLIDPNGNPVALAVREGDGGQNFGNAATNQPTTFDDNAPTPISQGQAPFIGTFKPDGELANYINENPNGNWTLDIQDTQAGDTGTLIRWSLDISTGVPSQVVKGGNPMDQNANAVAGENPNDIFANPRPLSQVPFQLPYDQQTLPLIVPGPHVVNTFVPGQTPTPDNLVLNATVSALDVVFDRNMDPASFTAADVTQIVGPTGAIQGPFSIAPDATANDPDKQHPRTFRITFPAQQLSGTYNIVLAPVPDANNQPTIRSQAGDALDTNLNAGLDVLRGTNPGNGGKNVTTGQNTSPTTLAPGQSTDSTIRITDNFTIQDASLNFNINAQNDAALTALLIAPDGTQVTLFSNLPGSNFTNTTLSDFASTPISSGTAPYNGAFRPQQSLDAALRGKASAFGSGVYTLRIINNGTTATLLNWTLTLQQGVPVTASNGTAVPVPPGKTVSSAITVGDSFPLEDTSVVLNIASPRDQDLEAWLQAPDGTVVKLFTNVGSPTAPTQGFVNTVLTDFASTPIQPAGGQQGGTPPFSGSFNPQQPLGQLNGKNAKGTWQLFVKNDSTTRSSTIQNWTLRLLKAVTGTGLGEPVADQATLHFRIFTMDQTNPLAHDTWTAVGPAAINAAAPGTNGQNSGRIGGLALDPADPSGNTVYLGGASGGVWKTTDFLTTSPAGPTYVPLTDFGPTFGMNIGSIATFGVNNDPHQTMVFALTGEGDTGSKGVGILRSLDGGLTWTLLDSATNVDANGNLLPIAQRKHDFVGTTGFKVVVDPQFHLNPATGKPGVVIFMALGGNGGNGGGIWESFDTGNTWTHLTNGLPTGDATDIVLAPNSVDPASGNLRVAYAAIEGQGVYMTQNEGLSWFQLKGGAGDPDIRDGDFSPALTISVANGPTPNGAKGRITLATPGLTGSPLQDKLYQGWVYALVATPSGAMDGLYLMKDAGTTGGNWTRIQLPAFIPQPYRFVGFPTNDEVLTATQTRKVVDYSGPADVNVFGNTAFTQGNYDQSLAIDPNNPNVVYVGGTNDGAPQPIGGLIRVDTTGVYDPHALVAFDYNDNDGGTIWKNSTASVNLKKPGIQYGVYQQVFDPTFGNFIVSPPTPGGQFVDQFGNTPFLNLLTDPYNPFNTNATILTTGVRNAAQGVGFNNPGTDIFRWMPFNDAVNGTTDQHRVVSFRDPLTGRTRLIFGDDQGVFSAVDDGTGNLINGVGLAAGPETSRNGNLQITQFYYGAVQPTVLAAEVAAAVSGQFTAQGGLFYGNAQDDGFPVSDPHTLTNGNLSWQGPLGDGTGIATDQTGSGTAYSYQWPCCGIYSGISTTEFFLVNPNGTGYINRTGNAGGSLVQAQNPGQVPDPQWPFVSVMTGGGPSSGGVVNSNFAVNPINANQITISSLLGRIFLTGDQGRTWAEIGFDAGDNGATSNNTLDGAYTPALAFGAPDPHDQTGFTDNFIYAGNVAGNIWVYDAVQTPAVPAHWIKYDTSSGLDGSTVERIVADPTRGLHDAYAVTAKGVYYIADSLAPGAKWQNITGNVFSLGYNPFGSNLLGQKFLGDSAGAGSYLTSIVADWRFVIPNGAGQVGTPTGSHPALYVGGETGVFRSMDDGKTWTVFPDTADDGAPVNGGYLPVAHITDLQLAVGAINPTTGKPDQSAGPNLLVATTYGRGSFAIRLPINSPFNRVSGPRVVSLSPGSPVGPGISSVIVTFSGVIDPSTFTLDDIDSLTGPGGPIQATAVKDVTAVPPGTPNPHNVWEIDFAPQLRDGVYTIVLGPHISDFAGNEMDQNQNGVNGEVPQDEFTGQFVVNSTDNGRFIIGDYNDLLSRQPDTGSFVAWLTPMDNARFGLLPKYATTLVTSDEVRSDLLYNPNTKAGYYPRFLERTPSPTEMSGWLAALRNGLTPEQVVAIMVSSPEYFQQNTAAHPIGEVDANWVAQIYQDLLARPADLSGKQNFLTLLTNAEIAARQAVGRGLVANDEYYADLLYNPNTGTDPNTAQGYYPKFLGRLPSSQEVQSWLPVFRAGARDEQVIASIVSTDEFFNHAPAVLKSTSPPSNDTFVRALFVLLLGRQPGSITQDQVQPWENVLANGGTRLQVAQGILNTDEYRTVVVTSIFTHLLGRSPTPDDLNVWVPFLRNGGTDEQVLVIVLSSPEYFHNKVGADTKLSAQDADWVKAAYPDVLVRPADANGLSGNLAILAQAELSARMQVVSALVGSTEYLGDQVYNPNNNTGYFPYLLNRAASPGEVNAWVGVLKQGPTGAGQPNRDEQVEIGLVSSQEYFFDQTDPKDPTLHSNLGWFTSLFANPHLFGRTDPNGIAAAAQAWVVPLLNDYLPQRHQVTAAILGTDEYRANVVNTDFQKYLRRAASPAEVGAWVAALRSGNTDEQFIQALVSSAEYFQSQKLGNGNVSTYVDQVYQDLFNRAADPGSKTAWVNYLTANNNQAGRSVFVGTLLGSSEYKADLVAGYYNTYLQRARQGHPKPVPANPNDPELNPWVNALLQGVRDEQVINALFDSPEYFLLPHP